ncbi:cyclodeaminase/cyclohydrolase family protein [Oceanicoccus sp. KOV_DT_Chl]|uniref:cyclodeaminase/cyclohydrolase family protein n=1 Tax=Oceanicoccus sp. KOV_DT_Chl TaxID=1904639 RepID=UPI000C7AFF5F|nr:cyclodeaminase/cyclohydrolase family protein [Oceanicoccus sp. KOV_DT_Chl]
MDRNLLDTKTTSELLDMFGAGEHKPGSGSAAALQGMLSAQLILTVISLTIDPKRHDAYKHCVEKTKEAAEDIRSRIYPTLQRLFLEDSALFDKVIKLRVQRDAEKNPIKKQQFDDEATAALTPATEIPVEIAELCAELAVYGVFIFDNGFKSARGDASVAMNGAVSAIAGCLSIIDLNLLKFEPSDWSANISTQAKLLRTKYETLSAKSFAGLDDLSGELTKNIDFYSRANAFKTPQALSSDKEIEDYTIYLQRFMWVYRKKIWGKDAPKLPLEMLKPELAIRFIGYNFQEMVTLGQHVDKGITFDVAGIIHNPEKSISISEQFPLEYRNFTAAHELGHALMHEQNVLHRDRPLDGSNNSPQKDNIEYQADKFATYFLMPEKQVRRAFETMYLTSLFEISDLRVNLALAKDADKLRNASNIRDLSIILTSLEYYNGKPRSSLAKLFNVSTTAMARRLEELDLVRF